MTQNPQVVTGVREGDVLAGKYRVERILGYGGMGVVVAAHHLQLDSRVAMKFLLPETLSNAEAVARFAREARASVKIQSEHVAKVTDVGTLESGAPYMVMEYLEGSDLAGWIQNLGVLPVDQAVDFVLQACEAIAEAHSLGIVHRDLKPANLFVIRRPDGAQSVKVLDFGISKMSSAGTGGSDMTRTSAIMGSPLYMSPEQLQSAKSIDARSDVWSVGVILYELLTGQVPFVADTMPGLVAQILSVPPRPVRDVRSDLPEGLDDVLRRCLDKAREKRFQSIGALANALAPFSPERSKISLERISGIMSSSGMGGTTLVPTPASDPVQASTGGATVAAWEGSAKARGRGRFLLATTAAMVGTLALAAVALRTRSLDHAASASPPTEPATTEAVAMPSAAATEHAVATVSTAALSVEVVPAAPVPEPSATAARAPLPAAGMASKPPQPRPAKAASVAPTTAPTSRSETVPSAADLRPAAAQQSVTKPGCKPNFYYDAHGNKHFKPECF